MIVMKSLRTEIGRASNECSVRRHIEWPHAGGTNTTALICKVDAWAHEKTRNLMVLGNHPVPWRPTIWMIVGQGPIALTKGAGGFFLTFLLSSIFSLLFLLLFGRRPDID